MFLLEQHQSAAPVITAKVGSLMEKDRVMSPTKFLQPGLLALALMPLMVGGASAAADPTGVWMNDTGRGAVEIKNCGGNLCGNVVWVKNSADAKGCGKQVIGDVAPVGGGVWDNGWVYSPEKGRKYDVEITPLND